MVKSEVDSQPPDFPHHTLAVGYTSYQISPEIVICHLLSSRLLRPEIHFHYKRIISECQFHILSVHAKDKKSHVKTLNKLFSHDDTPILGDNEHKYYCFPP